MVSEPWQRMKAAPIPTQPSMAEALDQLTDEQLLDLVRANLLPRDPAQRRVWQELWATIAADQGLTETVVDGLEQWQETTRAALAVEGDPAVAKRMTKFLATTDSALDRVDQPLAWAGPVAGAYNRADRRTLQELVDAICAYRDLTGESTAPARALYHRLQALHLDPDTEQTAPDGYEPEVRDGALGWASAWASKFSPAGRSSIQALLTGLANHRHATTVPSAADRQLWQAAQEIYSDWAQHTWIP